MVTNYSDNILESVFNPSVPSCNVSATVSVIVPFLFYARGLPNELLASGRDRVSGTIQNTLLQFHQGKIRNLSMWEGEREKERCDT